MWNPRTNDTDADKSGFFCITLGTLKPNWQLSNLLFWNIRNTSLRVCFTFINVLTLLIIFFFLNKLVFLLRETYTHVAEISQSETLYEEVI